MKSILLDTLNHKIKTIELSTDPDYKEIAKTLGDNVKYIQCVGILANGDRIYASGNPIAEGFECHIISHYTQVKIINSAIIIGVSEDGKFKDPLISLQEVQKNFSFSVA